MVDIFGNDVISIEESRDFMEHHPKDLDALLNSLAVGVKDIHQTLLEYKEGYYTAFSNDYQRFLVNGRSKESTIEDNIRSLKIM